MQGDETKTPFTGIGQHKEDTSPPPGACDTVFGEYVNGKMHGTGMLTDNDGALVFYGQYQDDEAVHADYLKHERGAYSGPVDKNIAPCGEGELIMIGG